MDCFGCVGLQKKQYCILNKQYSKENYFGLKSKIIEHMQKTGEWGEFFPASQSLFAYNESIAHQEYYPLKDRAEMGDIVWQTTKDDGQRQSYGKKAESYGVQTVLLPLVRKEDVDRRISHKRGKKNENYVIETDRDREQLVRLIKSAKAQGGLLSGAEVSVLMNRSLTTIGRLLKEHFRRTGEILPMKGYVLDQGSNPTHKAIIISLYEQGLSPLAIARKTDHTQRAVDRYLKTYEQVLQLVKKGHNAYSICQITGRTMQTVVQYLRLVKEFYPKMKVDVAFKTEQHKIWYNSKKHPKQVHGQMS
jgi:DNA-binding NarL/FixJ family response regulator